MSTSNTLTKNDLKKVLEKLSISTGGEGALNDMTTQEIEDFLNEIEADGPNLVDYVVEQSTSGIWTYRKWNSGIAECWGQKSLSGSYAAWGYIYSFDISGSNYPTGLFLEKPVCTAMGQCESGNSMSSIEGGGSNTTTPGIIVIRGTAQSGTYTFYAYYHAIGRWK